MGLIHAAAIAAILGKKRRCAKCGAVQIVNRLDANGKYCCKHCGHVFGKKELKSSA